MLIEPLYGQSIQIGDHIYKSFSHSRIFVFTESYQEDMTNRSQIGSNIRDMKQENTYSYRRVFGFGRSSNNSNLKNWQLLGITNTVKFQLYVAWRIT